MIYASKILSVPEETTAMWTPMSDQVIVGPSLPVSTRSKRTFQSQFGSVMFGPEASDQRSITMSRASTRAFQNKTLTYKALHLTHCETSCWCYHNSKDHLILRINLFQPNSFCPEVIPSNHGCESSNHWDSRHIFHCLHTANKMNDAFNVTSSAHTCPFTCLYSHRTAIAWCSTSSSLAGQPTGTHLSPSAPSSSWSGGWPSGRSSMMVEMGGLWCTACESNTHIHDEIVESKRKEVGTNDVTAAINQNGIIERQMCP